MMDKREYPFEKPPAPFQMGNSATIEEEKQRSDLSKSRELDDYLSKQRDQEQPGSRASSEHLHFKLQDADQTYQLRKPSAVMQATLNKDARTTV